MAVILGLGFVAPMRKEWPMTFIAVRCPYCQSDQIVKRGTLLLDSRVVELPMSSNPIVVTLSSLKPFFFNGLQ